MPFGKIWLLLIGLGKWWRTFLFGKGWVRVLVSEIIESSFKMLICKCFVKNAESIWPEIVAYHLYSISNSSHFPSLSLIFVTHLIIIIYVRFSGLQDIILSDSALIFVNSFSDISSRLRDDKATSDYIFLLYHRKIDFPTNFSTFSIEAHQYFY